MNTLEIRKFFEVIKDDNKLTEIRILGEKGRTFSGYFNDVESLIAAVEPYQNYNIYFTLNGINPACASRTQANQIVQNPKNTTSDSDIISREWVLIDLDPKRPADTNATDEEKKKAQAVVNRIYTFLRDTGFAKPIVCDSSNGYHLLYKVIMTNTPENTELVKNFLNALSVMFSTDEVEVDTSVFNASRICKLYGTTSRKGSNTKERPQRESRIHRIPSVIKPTSYMLLERVANMMPKPEKKSYTNNYNPQFNIDDFIHRNGLHIDREMMVNGGTRKILLKECPFNGSHKSPDSAIFVLPSGAIGFKCFHNSCANNTWHDLREKYEPKQQRQQQTRYDTKPQSAVAKKEVKGDMFLQMKDVAPQDRSAIISMPSGFRELDNEITGFNLGEVTLWSGLNASGKSSVLSQIALNCVERGFKVAMVSGELKAQQVKLWLDLQAAGRQYTEKDKKYDYYYTPKNVIDYIDNWLENKFWLYNNEYGNKSDVILKGLEDMVAKGVNCFILDNLMALDTFAYQGDKYEQQKQLILDLCAFAKRFNIHIHIVAHPRKTQGFLRKVDVAGTADLTNAVDNVLIVHRVNSDFIRFAGEFMGHEKASQYFKYGNVIEICKNRDRGSMDFYVGLYYEIESKRFLNEQFENVNYGWIPKQLTIDDFPVGDEFDDLPV